MSAILRAGATSSVCRWSNWTEMRRPGRPSHFSLFRTSPAGAIVALHGRLLRGPTRQARPAHGSMLRTRSWPIRVCSTYLRTFPCERPAMRIVLHCRGHHAGDRGVPTSAGAQDYPTKPVRVFVTSTAGGPLDVFTRLVTNKMEQELKQPFVSRTALGAGGHLAVVAALQAPADGYTILFSIDTTFTVNPSLFKQIPSTRTRTSSRSRSSPSLVRRSAYRRVCP